ncbi:unnamed protein product [Didymodactylos carnosus]|uniref:Uncharacterized protein n=1 Tax=Didymodactylos carnosus TaxID=1234261 RepID=A0A814P732_9BILA|nr:unnamed protein product [Didymodactylos carnosus]CAF3868614.1 unnamed protein product [Didymodactylos carnosus]
MCKNALRVSFECLSPNDNESYEFLWNEMLTQNKSIEFIYKIANECLPFNHSSFLCLYNKMGKFHEQKFDYSTAIYYYKKKLDIELNGSVITYNQIQHLYIKLDDISSALLYLKKMYDIQFGINRSEALNTCMIMVTYYQMRALDDEKRMYYANACYNTIKVVEMLIEIIHNWQFPTVLRKNNRQILNYHQLYKNLQNDISILNNYHFQQAILTTSETILLFDTYFNKIKLFEETFQLYFKFYVSIFFIKKWLPFQCDTIYLSRMKILFETCYNHIVLLRKKYFRKVIHNSRA